MKRIVPVKAEQLFPVIHDIQQSQEIKWKHLLDRFLNYGIAIVVHLTGQKKTDQQIFRIKVRWNKQFIHAFS